MLRFSKFHVLFLSVFIINQLLCAASIQIEAINFLSKTPKRIEDFKNTIRSEDNVEKRTTESNVMNVDDASKEKLVDILPAFKMNNMFKNTEKSQNEFRIKKRELGYFKTPAKAARDLSVWNFGGTWSSEIAGVRFEMDTRSTVGMDKHLPVKILDRAAGTVSNGFMNKTWMAKANAQYGRDGPIELFAINRPEKIVAVFIGFVHTQNGKDILTGIWSVGRNCKDNLDVHQSVYNIPDILRRDTI